MEKGIIVHTIILNDEKEFLIMRRSAENDVLPGYWDIPGGTLLDGEDPAQGAIRETKEETGLNIKDVKLFSYHSNIDKEKNKQFLTLIFLSGYKEGDIVLNKDEHDDFKWVGKEDVSKYKTVDYLMDCASLIL